MTGVGSSLGALPAVKLNTTFRLLVFRLVRFPFLVLWVLIFRVTLGDRLASKPAKKMALVRKMLLLRSP